VHRSSWIERLGRSEGLPADRLFPSLEERPSFSFQDLARLFGVTVQAVHQWYRTGKLLKVARTSRRGQYRLPRREVIRLLQASGRSVTGLWENPKARQVKILFIDDDSPVRRFVEEISQTMRAPLLLRTAPNVEDGIMLAAEFLPDVLYLDYYFGRDRLRGDAAVAFIRKAKAIRDARLIAVASDSGIGRKMVAAGADEFIRKPFGAADLRASFQEQIARCLR
jgi:CheY-like chemotaxis protein